MPGDLGRTTSWNPSDCLAHGVWDIFQPKNGYGGDRGGETREKRAGEKMVELRMAHLVTSLSPKESGYDSSGQEEIGQGEAPRPGRNRSRRELHEEEGGKGRSLPKDEPEAAHWIPIKNDQSPGGKTGWGSGSLRVGQKLRKGRQVFSGRWRTSRSRGPSHKYEQEPLPFIADTWAAL